MGRAVRDFEPFDDGLREDRLVALRGAAGICRGQPDQRLRHLPALEQEELDGARRTRSDTMINDPILAVAVRAARRAGSIIDRRRARPEAAAVARAGARRHRVAADTEAENAIIATLRAAFPGHAILGEETGEIVSQIRRRRAAPAALPLDRRSDRRHGQLRPRLSVLRGVDRAHPRQRHHARGRARSGPRRAVHGDPGQGRAAERRADPRLGLHALEEALVGTVFPTRASPKMPAYLPRLQRAGPALRRHTPRRRRARSISPTSPRVGSTASG